MASNTSLTTDAAFDALDDEIEARLAKLQGEIADAARRGGFDRVGELAKAARNCPSFARICRRSRSASVGWSRSRRSLPARAPASTRS
jgi:hypothetical protein